MPHRIRDRAVGETFPGRVHQLRGCNQTRESIQAAWFPNSTSQAILQCHLLMAAKVRADLTGQNLGDHTEERKQTIEVETISHQRVLHLAATGLRPRNRHRRFSRPTHELTTFMWQRLPPVILFPEKTMVLIRGWRKTSRVCHESGHCWGGGLSTSVCWVEKFTSKRVDSPLSLLSQDPSGPAMAGTPDSQRAEAAGVSCQHIPGLGGLPTLSEVHVQSTGGRHLGPTAPREPIRSNKGAGGGPSHTSQHRPEQGRPEARQTIETEPWVACLPHSPKRKQFEALVLQGGLPIPASVVQYGRPAEI